MNQINWDNFKCRCSGISKIMANSRSNPQITDKQLERLKQLEAREVLTDKHELELAELRLKMGNRKKALLSDSCIEYLMELYAYETQGMRSIAREQNEILTMKKGKLAEEDSITLLSIIDGILYEKNDEVIENDFLRGEPDVYVGPEVMKATKITDIKSCWDYPSFLKKISSGDNNGYILQVQGYCDITGATEGEIAYCLVNMPEVMQNDFKKRLFYSGEYISDESPSFLKEWKEWQHSMIFDSIPHHKRVFKVNVDPFTDEQRQKVYDRVKVCREWLNNFDETYQSLGISLPLMLKDAE